MVTFICWWAVWARSFARCAPITTSAFIHCAFCVGRLRFHSCHFALLYFQSVFAPCWAGMHFDRGFPSFSLLPLLLRCVPSWHFIHNHSFIHAKPTIPSIQRSIYATNSPIHSSVVHSGKFFSDSVCVCGKQQNVSVILNKCVRARAPRTKIENESKTHRADSKQHSRTRTRCGTQSTIVRCGTTSL